MSDTIKYIGKVYGRTLLDEIKNDETQARNALKLQQQQQQRENTLKARQAAVNAAQKKVQAVKAGAKKPQTAKPSVAVEPARPAFLTTHFIPYRKWSSNLVRQLASLRDLSFFPRTLAENKMRTFQTNIPDVVIDRPATSNVAMVTIKPKSKSPLRRSKELARQVSTFPIPLYWTSGSCQTDHWSSSTFQRSTSRPRLQRSMSRPSPRTTRPGRLTPRRTSRSSR